MKLLIKQRVFSWRDTFDIYDEAGSRRVIHISKELFRWGDTYVLDFINPEDEATGLLLVLAIDAVNCSDND